MMRELQPEDPQLIGPYRLRGRLGAGGMGRVFLGLSAGGRPVAVKVIRAELATDPEFRARFRREVEVARKVSGLFTAPVIDADLDGPVPWLATAYVGGLSLAEAVSSHGPLPAGSVLALAAGLAEGLSAIHAAGVVHRDLKPANVLLADDGPRVIDFGISRAIESSALTHTGFVVGSPGFMSPEQANGWETGPPSDIFSLGAVLAFAATGEGPFGSGSTPALVYRVVHSPARLGELPAEVRPLIERCLAKGPGQRPTARDLLAEAGAAYPATGWLPEPVTRTFGQVPASTPGRAVAAAGYVPAADADTQPVATVTGSAVPNVPVTAVRPAPAPSQPRPRGDQHRTGRRWRPLAAAAVIAGIVGASATAGFVLTGAPAQAHDTATGQRAASVQTISPDTPAPYPSGQVTAAATTTPSMPASATTPASPAPSTPAPATTYPASSTSPTPSVSATPSTSATPVKSPTPVRSPTPSTSASSAPGGY
jgi:eukaryotic-like serine/threonine-protein kinase